MLKDLKVSFDQLLLTDLHDIVCLFYIKNISCIPINSAALGFNTITYLSSFYQILFLMDANVIWSYSIELFTDLKFFWKITINALKVLALKSQKKKKKIKIVES